MIGNEVVDNGCVGAGVELIALIGFTRINRSKAEGNGVDGRMVELDISIWSIRIESEVDGDEFVGRPICLMDMEVG